MDIFAINILKAQQSTLNKQKCDQYFNRIEQQAFQQNYCDKQCPDNDLDNDQKCNYQTQQNSKTQWTHQQQIKLFQLHDKLGNKWAIISQQIPGKTDNGVKNYLYSKLRKGLRKLNRIIHEHFRKQLLEIKVIVLYKIIQATQQKFKQAPFCNSELSDYCTELKNRIIAYSDDNNQFSNYQKYPSIGNQLINDLINFSKQYKRKAKKMRKNSGQQSNLISPSKILSSKNTNSQFDWSQTSSVKQSNVSIINSIPSSLRSYDFLKIQQDQPIRRRARTKQQIIIQKQQIQNDQQDAISQKMQIQIQNIQQILKDAGLSQDEFNPPNFQLIKKQSQNQYRMDGSEEVDQFQYSQYFQQSVMGDRIPLPMNCSGQLRNSLQIDSKICYN